MQSGDLIDTRAARRLIKRGADDMNSYADIMSVQVSALSNSRNAAFGALSNALALQVDFEDRGQNLGNLRQTLVSLIESTEIAKAGMSGMRASADALPRISRELNKAKRAVVLQLDLFLSEIENIRSTVANIVEAIDRMLPLDGQSKLNT